MPPAGRSLAWHQSGLGGTIVLFAMRLKRTPRGIACEGCGLRSRKRLLELRSERHGRQNPTGSRSFNCCLIVGVLQPVPLPARPEHLPGFRCTPLAAAKSRHSNESLKNRAVKSRNRLCHVARRPVADVRNRQAPEQRRRPRELDGALHRLKRPQRDPRNLRVCSCEDQ